MVLTRITSSKPSFDEFCDGLEFAENGGNVEDAVKSSETVDRAFDERLNIRRRAHIRHDWIDFAGR